MTLITRIRERSDSSSGPNRATLVLQLAKRKLIQAARTTAPVLIALSLTAIAHAQGTMDFSGAQTLMGTFNMCAARVQA